MDKRNRMHLEGWKSITRKKYAKLLLKAIYIYTKLEIYSGSNTGSDRTIMMNGSLMGIPMQVEVKRLFHLKKVSKSIKLSNI